MWICLTHSIPLLNFFLREFHVWFFASLEIQAGASQFRWAIELTSKWIIIGIQWFISQLLTSYSAANPMIHLSHLSS